MTGIGENPCEPGTLNRKVMPKEEDIGITAALAQLSRSIRESLSSDSGEVSLEILSMSITQQTPI